MLRDRLRRLSLNLAFLLGEKRTHAGIQLVYLPSDRADRDLFFSKVPAALDLIAAHDRRRYQAVKALLRRIALVPDGGEYVVANVATYFMDVPTLTIRPLAEVAMKVIHEMTHLRLRQLGIVPTDVNRERIEHMCVGQEIAFAERLPDSEKLIVQARAKLATRWWEPEQMRQRYRTQMQSWGVPPWLIRVFERLSR